MCSAPASSGAATATVATPSSLQVRKMRTAISPRFATRSLRIAIVCGSYWAAIPCPLDAAVARSPGVRPPRPARARAGRDDLPGRRPRLGPRDRDEPVRRPRLRAGGLGLPADPRPLLSPDEAAARPGEAGARAPRRREEVRADRLLEAVQGRRRPRQGAEAEGRRAERRRQEARAASLAAAVRARRGAAPPRRTGVPWSPARPPARTEPHDREQGPARPLPARCRPVGDAGRLAAGGTPRPGRGRALVRARDAEARDALRPLRGHPQPGLRRDRSGVADNEPSDRLDRGQGALLERARRNDLLPLDLGRPDRLDRGGLASCDPGAVSRLGRGSLRHALEAPPLGAAAADAGRG